MNLLEVRNSGKFIFHNADVQSVFEITRETFDGHFDKIREKYGDRELDSELLTIIGQMTGSKELIRMGRNMEVNNMCTALEKLKEEGKKEGMKEGMKEGIEEKGREVVRVMLQNKYPISEICKISGVTEEEVLAIKASM